MFVFNYRFLVVAFMLRRRKGDFVIFAWTNIRKPMHWNYACCICICNEKPTSKEVEWERVLPPSFITFGEINNRNALHRNRELCTLNRTQCIRMYRCEVYGNACVSVIAKCHNFRFGYLFTCHTISTKIQHTNTWKTHTRKYGRLHQIQFANIISSLILALFFSVSAFHAKQFSFCFHILSFQL